MSMYIGEGLVGEGNEIAHIDLLIGSKDGPVGQAFANASMLYVHVSEAGERTVRLPKPAVGVELFTGKRFDASSGAFEWNFQEHDVCLFLLDV